MCVCVCVCVEVRELGREGKRERKRRNEKQPLSSFLFLFDCSSFTLSLQRRRLFALPSQRLPREAHRRLERQALAVRFLVVWLTSSGAPRMSLMTLDVSSFIFTELCREGACVCVCV